MVHVPLLEFQALNAEVNLVIFPAFTTFSQCLMASKYRAGKPGDFVTTSKNITVKSKQKIDTQGACSAPLSYPTLYKCTKQEVMLTLSCKCYSDLQSSKKRTPRVIVRHCLQCVSVSLMTGLRFCICNQILELANGINLSLFQGLLHLHCLLFVYCKWSKTGVGIGELCSAFVVLCITGKTLLLCSVLC